MKIIDYSQLKLGDILLATSPAFESKSIRFGTKSDISHAMLYVANSSVIDSTGDGVQARNLQKMFYDDNCAIHALRLKGGLNSEQLEQILRYARSATGAEYSVFQAVKSIMPSRGDGNSKQFCSRLVARAYDEAGIRLVANPDFCTPQNIKTSPLLELLPSPVVSISNKEFEAVKLQPDSIRGMIDVTNDFLSKVRRLSPNIQTINDSFNFLMENPRADEEFLNALSSSNYLDYWRVLVQEFPWRYNFESMETYSKLYGNMDEVTNYCKNTLVDEQSGTFNHWKYNLEVHKQLAKDFPLKSFDAMVILYENLVASQQARVEVAYKWLSNH